MNMLEYALKYVERGLCIIPVGHDKKPLIKWERYQKEFPSESAISGWFKKWPDMNIGMVTGSISGISVIDIDTEEGEEGIAPFIKKPRTIIVSTPRGGKHIWYKHEDGLRNSQGFIKGVDFRGEGGYVVLPPSKTDIGEYKFKTSFEKNKFPPVPDAVKKILLNKGFGSSSLSYNNWGSQSPGLRGNEDEQKEQPRDAETQTQYDRGDDSEEGYDAPNENEIGQGPYQDRTPTDSKDPIRSGSVKTIAFDAGGRDESLFHVATCLMRGGMSETNIFNVVEFLGNQCNPPFSPKDSKEKVISAIKRGGHEGMSNSIYYWVMESSGTWSVDELDRDLNISTTTQKDRRGKVIRRMLDKGIIVKHPTKKRWFRTRDVDMTEMDVNKPRADTEPINLPFNLHSLVKLYPGNIVVVAGEPNAGKTALMLNIMADNMHQYHVHYFNSEMGEEELADRLREFQDVDYRDFKKAVHFYERSGNFSDVVATGKGNLNIIDFLEIYDNFYEIGGMINDIHKNLNGAIAIIALQKNKGTSIGLGGFRGLEKARLYMSMSPGQLYINKAKAWRDKKNNPNGMTQKFKIVNGITLIPTDPWSVPEEEG